MSLLYFRATSRPICFQKEERFRGNLQSRGRRGGWRLQGISCVLSLPFRELSRTFPITRPHEWNIVSRSRFHVFSKKGLKECQVDRTNYVRYHKFCRCNRANDHPMVRWLFEQFVNSADLFVSKRRFSCYIAVAFRLSIIRCRNGRYFFSSNEVFGNVHFLRLSRPSNWRKPIRRL